jgi:hypothetical protein
MAAYVLVPGAWLGGWAWRAVAGRLRANGHDVFPITLTGLGERVHLARPEIDLETHIDDVVNTVQMLSTPFNGTISMTSSWPGIATPAASSPVSPIAFRIESINSSTSTRPRSRTGWR